MNTHTLFELVDLAIESPEKGAVNFNLLNLLLKSILKKSRLSEHTVRYKAVDPETVMRKILDPTGEISASDVGEIDEDLEDMDEKIEDKESSAGEDAKVDENDITDSEKRPAPELEKLSTSVQSLQYKVSKVQENVESIERLMKRKKRGMVEKTEFEDSQNTDAEEEFDLNRKEFDETIDEIKESIAQLGNKLIEQEQSAFGPAREEAINMLCEKIAEKEIEKRQGDFNDRLKHLAANVVTMKNFIKEYLYPEAAGVTKCVTCGRLAHLPNLDLLRTKPEETRADRKPQEFIRKRTLKKNEKQKKHELKFTLLSLDNIKKGAKLPSSELLQQDQERPLTLDARMESDDTGKNGKTSVNVFNMEEAASAFMPLRLIPDPSRSGTLLADSIHINPEVMSVSLIGVRKPRTLRFQAKENKDENA